MELNHYKKDKDKQHEIIGIEPDSIAEELEIEVGDRLVSINEKVVNDALDYHLFVKEEIIDLVIYKKAHDEAWLYEIEKDEDEDLGLIFDNNLMDEYTSCRNKCVFCFIDQLPEGLRETLYFKDDDARLSFLQGNYITLTNMTEREVNRIIEYHLSPVNISVHTMNLELRKEMLKNRFAGRIKEDMDRLYEAGISMNGQIVLCKGLNDKEELDYSIRELTKYLPHMQSMSVVPVGLSKYREGLYPLEPFTKDECAEVIRTVEKWQDYAYEKYGSHFVHCGDEFYIMAEQDVPEADRYDGYLQLENGVGMARLLVDTTKEQIEEIEPCKVDQVMITLVTGKLFEKTIRDISELLMAKVEGLRIQVIGITNEFFGERINISGLLVGKDIIEQLKGKDLGEKVLIPDNVFRDGDTVLLDDSNFEDLQESIDAEVEMVDYLGQTLIDTILDNTTYRKQEN